MEVKTFWFVEQIFAVNNGCPIILFSDSEKKFISSYVNWSRDHIVTPRDVQLCKKCFQHTSVLICWKNPLMRA